LQPRQTNSPTRRVDAAHWLAQYAGQREADIARSVAFTDLLASSFLPDSAALRLPRGLALAALDMLPTLRRALASRMLFGASR